MKITKKTKLKKLNFYTIDDTYINYLSNFDKHIAYNKNQKRPYIGIIKICVVTLKCLNRNVMSIIH